MNNSREIDFMADLHAADAVIGEIDNSMPQRKVASTATAHSPTPPLPPQPAPVALEHEQSHKPDDDNTESPEELPLHEFEIDEVAYWYPGDGTPTKSQLTTLKHAVKDIGRGFGGKVYKIAKNNRFDPNHPNTRAPVHEDGHQFAQLALEYKNADKARREEILTEELSDTGLEGSSYEQAYKEARRRLKRDLDAASELEPQEISNLGQAIADYRFLERNLKDAGVAYKKRNAWGRAGVKLLKGGKEFLASPGTAAAATLIRLRTRKSAADPEKTGKLRRGLKAGSVAVVGAFLFYRGAAGVVELAKAGGEGFTEGATDLSYWPPFDFGEPIDADSSSDESGDAGTGEGQDEEEDQTGNGSSDEPQENGEPEPKIQREIGEWDAETGEGSVWGTVRDYARNDLGLELTEQQIHDATDKALIRDNIGGEGAGYAERWEAAKRLGADHEISLSPDLFEEAPETPEDTSQTSEDGDTEETPPEEPIIQTQEIGTFTTEETLDPTTHYVEGTAYNAIGHALNDQAAAAGFGKLDFAKLQQTPGFNETYHDFVDKVLADNGLDWNDAEHLQSNRKLDIKKSTLLEFLDRVRELQAPAESGSEHVPAAVPASEAPAPIETQARQGNQEVFRHIFQGNPQTAAFTHHLINNPAALHSLYPTMPVADIASYTAIHHDIPPAPQIYHNGRQFIDLAFVQNAQALMAAFLEQDEEKQSDYALAA